MEMLRVYVADVAMEDIMKKIEKDKVSIKI